MNHILPIFIAALLIFPAHSLAKTKESVSEGTYNMGDGETCGEQGALAGEEDGCGRGGDLCGELFKDKKLPVDCG